MMEGGTVTGEVSPAVLLRCAVCVEQRASSVSRRCVMIRVTYYATHKCPQTHTIKTHVMTTHGGGASRVHFACVHLVATPTNTFIKYSHQETKNNLLSIMHTLMLHVLGNDTPNTRTHAMLLAHNHT